MKQVFFKNRYPNIKLDGLYSIPYRHQFIFLCAYKLSHTFLDKLIAWIIRLFS